MSRAADHCAAVRHLTELYSPERLRKPAAAHDLLAQIEAGSAALAARVARWRPLMPKTADLAEAERAAAGLLRMLGELRQQCEEPPDAA